LGADILDELIDRFLEDCLVGGGDGGVVGRWERGEAVGAFVLFALAGKEEDYSEGSHGLYEVLLLWQTSEQRSCCYPVVPSSRWEYIPSSSMLKVIEHHDVQCASHLSISSCPCKSSNSPTYVASENEAKHVQVLSKRVHVAPTFTRLS